MNGKAGAVFTIMVACLALETIMKDQLNSGSCSNGNMYEEAEKNRKERDCVGFIRFVISVYLRFCFWYKDFRFTEFGISVICHVVLILCLGSFQISKY